MLVLSVVSVFVSVILCVLWKCSVSCSVWKCLCVWWDKLCICDGNVMLVVLYSVKLCMLSFVKCCIYVSIVLVGMLFFIG